MSRFDVRHWTTVVMQAALLFFVGAFCWCLMMRHWSDSEIWGLRQAVACMTDWKSYACSWKPLFHGLVGSLDFFLPLNALADLMRSARILVIPFWLASLFIFWRKGQNTLLLISFLGSSLFFLDSSVARSDFFALPFLMIYFCGLLHTAKTQEKTQRWNLLLSALVAVLITPKSLIPLFTSIPLLLPIFRSLSTREKKISFSITLAVGALCFLVMDTPRTAQFFLNLWTQENYGMPYWSWERFSFLRRSFSENPQIPLILLVGLGLALKERHLRPELLATILMNFFVLFLFPDKLPFWISLQVFLIFYLLADFFQNTAWARRLATALAVFSVLNGIHWIVRTQEWNHEEQARVLDSIETSRRLGSPRTIYDGVGLMFNTSLSSIYIGPGSKKNNVDAVQQIPKSYFDLILMTNRLSLFYPSMSEALAQHYAEISPNVFARSVRLKIKNPQRPGLEILTALRQQMGRGFAPMAEVAILTRDETDNTWLAFQERTFSPAELKDLPPLCTKCRDLEVTVTPYGQFLGMIGTDALSRLFSFEPESPRRSLFSVFSQGFN